MKNSLSIVILIFLLMFSNNCLNAQLSVGGLVAKEAVQKVLQDALLQLYSIERVKMLDEFEGTSVVNRAYKLAKKDLDDYYHRKLEKLTKKYDQLLDARTMTADEIINSPYAKEFNNKVDELNRAREISLQELDGQRRALIDYFKPYWESNKHNWK